MNIKEILTGLFEPIASIIRKRQERNIARDAAAAKLMQAKADNLQKIALNKDEWEQLQVTGMGSTWKDEYVTVSVVSILNILVVGGLASGFGHDQIIEGIGVAIQALALSGVDLGFLMEASILAGLGLSVWKRL
jgi:hypothetical protein